MRNIRRVRMSNFLILVICLLWASLSALIKHSSVTRNECIIDVYPQTRFNTLLYSYLSMIFVYFIKTIINNRSS